VPVFRITGVKFQGGEIFKKLFGVLC
jgi:hypothetical protein